MQIGYSEKFIDTQKSNQDDPRKQAGNVILINSNGNIINRVLSCLAT